MIRDYLKKSGFFVLVARDGTKSFLFENQIKNAPLWMRPMRRSIMQAKACVHWRAKSCKATLCYWI
jgi:hypothetical protein